MSKNFTESTILILQKAEELATALSHQVLSPFHVLKILLESAGNYIIHKSLQDINVIQFIRDCDSELDKINKVEGAGNIILSQELASLINQMNERTKLLGDSFIGLDNFIYILFTSSPIKNLFLKNGGDIKKLAKILGEIRMNNKIDSENAESSFSALERYTKDITSLASEGKLDPVIGRDDEIRRAIQILSRRTKNNPILIGEPGVGKTAIAEGLASRIIKHDVPDSIKNKRILSLDLGALVAGAKFRGEFEERLKAVLNQISKTDDIVLFIDEIHMLIGAGKTDGAMDASNMLKPALARGELRCIGSTDRKSVV